MKNGGQYFKEPADQAIRELFEWAAKWFHEEIQIGMLIIERDDRNAVLTLVSDELPEPSRADRLRILSRAIDAITSHKTDSEHAKVKL